MQIKHLIEYNHLLTNQYDKKSFYKHIIELYCDNQIES